jgi:hypothetical protein
MAEDAEKIPGRPVFSVGGREELKTRGGSLSSEGANAAVQAERSTPIKVLRPHTYSNALISNAMFGHKGKRTLTLSVRDRTPEKKKGNF